MAKISFKERWQEAVDKKNSVLCAGIDPAGFGMGRGDKGLPKGVKKMEWTEKYIRAVAPYVAAVKPNLQYWKGIGGMLALREIYDIAQEYGLVVIDDSKLADIGSTNDAGIYHASYRADAVTFSPFAGNLEEAVNQAHKRDLGLIPMVLMSNPEYEREKNKLVRVTHEEGYRRRDVLFLDSEEESARESDYVRQYVQLAHDAAMFGADAVVIGAPSKKNHITSEEIAAVHRYVQNICLGLVPGVGEQGGEARELWKLFGKNDLIVNVGRGLMFPNGSGSTEKEQAEKAKYYMEMLNEARAKAA